MELTANESVDQRRADRWQWAVAAVVLAAAGFAVYANAIGHPFLIDDPQILRDPRVRALDVRGLLTQEYWPGGAGNRVWRPLNSLSLALNWAISPEPWTFRLVNLVLHLAGGLAVYLIGRAIALRFLPALLAGVLFVVHPIHTTPLNQIVDRADIAATTGILWAAWLFLWDRQAGSRWWRPIAGVALFGIALLFKESAVAFVGAVVCLHRSETCATEQGRAAKGSESGAAAWLRCGLKWWLPLLVVLGAYLAARTSVLGELGRPASAINPLDNVMAQPEMVLKEGDSVALARWGTPFAILARAADLLMWPDRLSWDHSYAAVEPVRQWSDRGLRVGIALLAVCIAAFVWSWWRRRPALVGLGLALAAYAVTANVFVLVGSAFAERYLYAVCAGVCLLAGGIIDWVRRLPVLGDAARCILGRAALIVGLAACLACGARTVVRNRDFASMAALNQCDVQAQPRSARLWTSVAVDRFNAGDHAGSISSAQKAMKIYPFAPDPWRIAGLSYSRLQQSDAAMQYLEAAVALGGAGNENASLALAALYKSRGQFAEAIKLLGDLLEQVPRSAAAQNNLAWYLLTAEPDSLRDPARAAQRAAQAVDIEPSIGDYLDTYIAALLAAGRGEEARRELAARLPRLPADDPQRPALEQKLAEWAKR